MPTPEQKKKLLKAKIAVALHDELGRVPKKEGYYSGFVSTATDDDKSFFKACSSTTAIFLKCY